MEIEQQVVPAMKRVRVANEWAEKDEVMVVAAVI